jgi:hypothetical protein
MVFVQIRPSTSAAKAASMANRDGTAKAMPLKTNL